MSGENLSDKKIIKGESEDHLIRHSYIEIIWRIVKEYSRGQETGKERER